MKNIFVLLVFLFPAISGFSQETGYTVFGITTNPYAGPYAILTLDTLQGAKTLDDIYGKYRSDWVAGYIAVEVTSDCNGVVRKAASKNDTLTQKQMGILKAADAGCRIDVEVDYLPKNTLKDNPPRKERFSLTPIPMIEAKYPGGTQHLQTYLRKNITDKVSKTLIESVKLAKARFKISETGQVLDAQIFKTSGEGKIDKLLLESICNMPKWSPAENSKGIKITQEFELSMGTALLLCPYPY